MAADADAVLAVREGDKVEVEVPEVPSRRPTGPGEKGPEQEARLPGDAVGTNPGVVVVDRDCLA